MKKTIIITSAVTLIVAILFSVVCVALFFKEFQQDRKEYIGYNAISKEYNESGEYCAVKYTASLGTRPKNGFCLSVNKTGETPKDTGNVYSSYNNFTYKWLDNNTLLIVTYDDEPIKNETQYKGIKIVYEEGKKR